MQATVYRQLQAALKNMKMNGLPVRVRLNSKLWQLQAEYDRMVALIRSGQEIQVTGSSAIASLKATGAFLTVRFRSSSALYTYYCKGTTEAATTTTLKLLCAPSVGKAWHQHKPERHLHHSVA